MEDKFHIFLYHVALYIINRFYIKDPKTPVRDPQQTHTWFGETNTINTSKHCWFNCKENMVNNIYLTKFVFIYYIISCPLHQIFEETTTIV